MCQPAGLFSLGHIGEFSSFLQHFLQYTKDIYLTGMTGRLKQMVKKKVEQRFLVQQQPEKNVKNQNIFRNGFKIDFLKVMFFRRTIPLSIFSFCHYL